MTEFPITRRNQIRQLTKRGHYDQAAVYDIIDQGTICHVGFTEGDQPFVIPFLYARLNDSLVLHGAPSSRLIKHLQAGRLVCVAITLLDGLVLARAVFHHSVNYRSVVLFGRGCMVEDAAEKLEALRVVTEHLAPGRWDDARPPTPAELNATAVVSIPIESASAKMRTGPPSDDDADYARPVWAGVVPIRQHMLEPENDPALREGIPVPEYLRRFIKKRS